MQERVIIFGASGGGKTAYEILQDNYNIIAFADNDCHKWDTCFFERKIISPAQISGLEYDKIVIASEYVWSIGRQLSGMGCRNIYVLCGQRDRSKLLEFDLQSLLNKGKEAEHTEGRNVRKKVLIVAYYFPPMGGAAVQRPLKYVKYLREFGYEPIVVTRDTETLYESMPMDNSLMKEIPDGVEILRFLADKEETILQLSVEERQKLFRMYRDWGVYEDWKECVQQHIDKKGQELLPDYGIAWALNVLENIEERIDLQSIDLIFTTIDPYSSSVIGLYLSKKYDIPWVLDYRDPYPWVTEELYAKGEIAYGDKLWEIQRRLEREFTPRADYVISVSEILSQSLSKKLFINKNRVAALENGYDETDFDCLNVVRYDKFTLCFNGSLYTPDPRFKDKNDCAALLVAINQLIDEGKIPKEEIQWVVSGMHSEAWQDVLEYHDSHGVLKLNGYLPHKQSIETAMGAQLLVTFVWSEKSASNGITGKVFECLRMGVPILFLGESADVYNQAVSMFDCGKNFAYADIHGIADFIYSYYQDWKKGKAVETGWQHEIKKYSRYALTEKLAGIFDTLLEG